MHLSIVIVSWNTRDLLMSCLASVFSDPPTYDFEVWVVDNASSDETVPAVREHFPQVRLIANQENEGFSRANNRAIRQCVGDYVLLLNPDTQVMTGSLEKLVEFMENHPEAGAAGARLLNPDRSLQISCHPQPTLSRELWRLFHLDALWTYGSYDMAAWSTEEPREVDVAKGACLMLRRAAMDEVGLLDEDYFIYSEEVDLCFRIRRGGWRLFWVPQAAVIHYEGQSTKQLPLEMFLRLYRGKILYFRKNHGWGAAGAYKLILMAATLARLLVGPLALLEPQPRRREHLTLVSRYRRLLVELRGM